MDAVVLGCGFDATQYQSSPWSHRSEAATDSPTNVPAVAASVVGITHEVVRDLCEVSNTGIGVDGGGCGCGDGYDCW